MGNGFRDGGDPRPWTHALRVHYHPEDAAYVARWNRHLALPNLVFGCEAELRLVGAPGSGQAQLYAYGKPVDRPRTEATVEKVIVAMADVARLTVDGMDQRMAVLDRDLERGDDE